MMTLTTYVSSVSRMQQHVQSAEYPALLKQVVFGSELSLATRVSLVHSWGAL